jgi:hypothetical protein
VEYDEEVGHMGDEKRIPFFADTVSMLKAMFYIYSAVSRASGKCKTGLILIWAGVGDVELFKIVGCVTEQEGSSGLEVFWEVKSVEGKDYEQCSCPYCYRDKADLTSIFFSFPIIQGIQMLVMAALMEKNRVCSVPTGSIRSWDRLSANFTKGFLKLDQQKPQKQKQQEKNPMH